MVVRLEPDERLMITTVMVRLGSDELDTPQRCGCWRKADEMRHKDENLMHAIKDFVEKYMMENNGKTPSIREIGAANGISHVSALRYLVAMNENGMLEYEDGVIRTRTSEKVRSTIATLCPVAGVIPCGTPEEQQENIEEYVPLPELFTGGKSGEYFILRTTGDSMVDADIDEDNLVIIRKTHEAEPEDIVAALVDGHESTLKRLKKDIKGLYLWAENESWEKEKRYIRGNFEIQGVAVRVVKKL